MCVCPCELAVSDLQGLMLPHTPRPPRGPALPQRVPHAGGWPADGACRPPHAQPVRSLSLLPSDLRPRAAAARSRDLAALSATPGCVGVAFKAPRLCGSGQPYLRQRLFCGVRHAHAAAPRSGYRKKARCRYTAALCLVMSALWRGSGEAAVRRLHQRAHKRRRPFCRAPRAALSLSLGGSCAGLALARDPGR